MGRESDGIFSTLRVAALIQQTGGGNGFSFSRLRPKGDVVLTSSGRATGPVGFLRVYDQAFGEIAQGGCDAETLVFTNAACSVWTNWWIRPSLAGIEQFTVQVRRGRTIRQFRHFDGHHRRFYAGGKGRP